MKAALFYGGKDIRVEKVPDPTPGSGEVLVRVRAAGVCGSDLHSYRDPSRVWPGLTLPYMSGHELAGEIAALGPDVRGLEVGQRVGVEPRHLVGCGRCRWCLRGDYQLCPELGRVEGKPVHSTGFAEYSLESADKIFPLPDSVSMEEASILDVYACAVHAVHRVPVSPTDIVVVQGAGAIGLTVAEVAKLAGAKQVIVCDILEAPLQVAKRIGADEVINASEVDSVEALTELTNGQGADVVFEAVGGTAPTFATDLRMVGRGGRVLIIGSFIKPQTIEMWDVQLKEVNLLWSWSYGLWEGVPEFKIALDMLAAGKPKAGELITHTFLLEQIGEAFAAADNKRESGAVKVVVKP